MAKFAIIVCRVKKTQKLIQTPLVVIYAALNFSKSINHKSNKQHFDRGVFSLVKKSTEKY